MPEKPAEQQRKWHLHATPASGADIRVNSLIAQLATSDGAVEPAVFTGSAGEHTRSPGLYSWWVDTAGAAELSRGLGDAVHEGLIYAGLAGSTRARSGRLSKNTLWGRITTMHLGGRHEFSTFRLSLGQYLLNCIRCKRSMRLH